MTIGETDVVGEVRWSPLLNMAGAGGIRRARPPAPPPDFSPARLIIQPVFPRTCSPRPACESNDMNMDGRSAALA